MSVRLIEITGAPVPDEVVYGFDWVLTQDVGQPQILLSEGDIIFFPDLMSGAGEFEGLFFVGATTTTPGVVPLHFANEVESLAFPAAMRDLAQSRGSSLRGSYRQGIMALAAHVGFELEEVYGDANALENMWNAPDVDEGPHEAQPIHTVPLAVCRTRVLAEYPITQ